MKNLIIPEELKKSFAHKADDRAVTPSGFQKWYADIIFRYHPVNNQIF